MFSVILRCENKYNDLKLLCSEAIINRVLYCKSNKRPRLFKIYYGNSVDGQHAFSMLLHSII